MLFRRCPHPRTGLTRLHSKAGYVHIVLKKELRDKLDALKVSTPYRSESYSDVISRLVGVHTQEVPGSVNTQRASRVSHQDTHPPKKEISRVRPDLAGSPGSAGSLGRVSRDSLKDLSLDQVVELKLAGRI